MGGTVERGGFALRRPMFRSLPDIDLPRVRPRSFVQWKTFKRWGELPESELSVPGFMLRSAREEAGLTQFELAEMLEVTQQAVAQAERWQSNPTIGFMTRWMRACGKEVEMKISTPLDHARDRQDA